MVCTVLQPTYMRRHHIFTLLSSQRVVSAELFFSTIIRPPAAFSTWLHRSTLSADTFLFYAGIEWMARPHPLLPFILC
jgi:hypothetical protein